MARVTLSKIDLEFQDAGRGPPVLFLHGLGGRGSDWQPQRARFEADHRVLTVDLMGHGDSSKPAGPYSVATFGQQVAEFVRQVVGGPVHLVGLSMGGMIAFQVAVDAPDLLCTMTIVNSGPELIPRNLTERWALASRVAIVKWLGLPKMAGILAPRLFPGSALAESRRIFTERFVANDRQGYLASLRAIIGWSVADRIANIAVPTLVVASELDYTPPSRKEEYVRRMPAAKMVVIPETHHAVPAEDPETFNAVLAEWLALHRAVDNEAIS